VFNSQLEYDAVVIIRGGGAQTDFLIFDNYAIGKAIAKFPIPVITGIGHQKNETIADLMAHTVTKTPTQAAERIIAHKRAFEEKINGFQKTIIIRSQQQLSAKMQRMASISNNLTQQTQSILFNLKKQLLNISGTLITKPTIVVAHKKKDIEQITGNIKSFVALFLKSKRDFLNHQLAMLNALSPQNTLNRGFAIVKTGDRITSNPKDLTTPRALPTVKTAYCIIKA